MVEIDSGVHTDLKNEILQIVLGEMIHCGVLMIKKLRCLVIWTLETPIFFNDFLGKVIH